MNKKINENEKKCDYMENLYESAGNIWNEDFEKYSVSTRISNAFYKVAIY